MLCVVGVGSEKLARSERDQAALRARVQVDRLKGRSEEALAGRALARVDLRALGRAVVLARGVDFFAVVRVALRVVARLDAGLEARLGAALRAVALALGVRFLAVERVLRAVVLLLRVVLRVTGMRNPLACGVVGMELVAVVAPRGSERRGRPNQ